MRFTQRLRQRRGTGEGQGVVRLLLAVLLCSGLVGMFAGGGSAYPCVPRDGAKSRALSQERPCRPPRRSPERRRHSSFAELAFAGGIFVAMLLLPVVPKNLSLLDDDRNGHGRF